MKLAINTARPSNYFNEGDRGYMLDAQNAMDTPKHVAEEAIKNLQTLGHSWKPTRFVPFTVTHMAKGGFEFQATSRLLFGSDKGITGISNPCIIREDEMEWLIATVKRLGTKDYAKIKEMAYAGDDEANRIVGFCETAYQFVVFQRFGGNNFSFFEIGQFLDAI